MLQFKTHVIIQNYDAGTAQFTSLAFLLIWLAIVHNPRALVSIEANIAPRYQVKRRGWHKCVRLTMKGIVQILHTILILAPGHMTIPCCLAKN